MLELWHLLRLATVLPRCNYIAVRGPKLLPPLPPCLLACTHSCVRRVLLWSALLHITLWM